MNIIIWMFLIILVLWNITQQKRIQELELYKDAMIHHQDAVRDTLTDLHLKIDLDGRTYHEGW